MCTGRGGLGRESEMKRRQETVAQMREQMKHKRAKLEEVSRGHFVRNMSSKFKDKEVEKDLYDSQKSCEHLDHAKVRKRKFSNFKIIQDSKLYVLFS